MIKGKMNIEADEFCKLVERFCRLMYKSLDDVKYYERFSLLCAHNEKGERIDFKRLAELDDIDFIHDVVGIDAHASRDDKDPGLLVLGFVPRCGFAKEAE